MGGGRVFGPPGKSQMAIGVLRNTGKDPLQGATASLGRSVRPSVKYVDV